MVDKTCQNMLLSNNCQKKGGKIMRNVVIRSLRIYRRAKRRNGKAIYALCHYTLCSFLPITVIKEVVAEAKEFSEAREMQQAVQQDLQQSETYSMDSFLENIAEVVKQAYEEEKNQNLDELIPYFTSLANFYEVDQTVISSLFLENEEKIIQSFDPEMVFLEILEQQLDRSNIPVTSTFLQKSSESGKQVIAKAKNSEIGAMYQKYAKMYGVDMNLLMAQAMQESGLAHDDFNPEGAYGISQIEHTLFGETISAYNYETGQMEELAITEEGALDLETNIRYGAARMQEQLRQYHNNVYIALQAYNYGLIMNDLLAGYAEERGLTLDQVTTNLNDFGWLEKVEDLHFYPQKYIEWEYETYGDNEYLANIMRYVDTDLFINKDENGFDVLTNLKNNQSIRLDGQAIRNYVAHFENSVEQGKSK